MSGITITVRKIECVETTGGSGPDEPYVIVFAADLTKLPPNVEATLYGPWSDVDSGEVHVTVPVPPGIPPELLDGLQFAWRKHFWGIDGQAAIIKKPQDVIILIGMMENDDGIPSSVRVVIKSFLFASLLSTVNSGMSRSDVVSKLIADMNSAFGFSGQGFPNSDDAIGSARELVLKRSELTAASRGAAVTKQLEFEGSGGKYIVFFDLRKG